MVQVGGTYRMPPAAQGSFPSISMGFVSYSSQKLEVKSIAVIPEYKLKMCNSGWDVLIVYDNQLLIYVDFISIDRVLSCRMAEWKLITRATQEDKLQNSLVGVQLTLTIV